MPVSSNSWGTDQNCPITRVQRFELSLTGSQTTINYTLPHAVDPTRSYAQLNGKRLTDNGYGGAWAECAVSLSSDGTYVTLQRYADEDNTSSGVPLTASIEVVEWAKWAVISIQHFSLEVNGGLFYDFADVGLVADLGGTEVNIDTATIVWGGQITQVTDQDQGGVCCGVEMYGDYILQEDGSYAQVTNIFSQRYGEPSAPSDSAPTTIYFSIINWQPDFVSFCYQNTVFDNGNNVNPFDDGADLPFDPDAAGLMFFFNGYYSSGFQSDMPALQLEQAILGTFTSSNVNVSTSEITITDNEFYEGEYIAFEGGTPPAPLQNKTQYYIHVIDDNTFQVGSTSDDDGNIIPITLTSAGSGTNTCYCPGTGNDFLNYGEASTNIRQLNYCAVLFNVRYCRSSLWRMDTLPDGDTTVNTALSPTVNPKATILNFMGTTTTNPYSNSNLGFSDCILNSDGSGVTTTRNAEGFGIIGYTAYFLMEFTG